MPRLITTTKPSAEKALLIGIDSPYQRSPLDVEESLEELAMLLSACGAEVLAKIIVKQPKPTPATYITGGKLEEAAGLVSELGATLVVFDIELNQRQVGNCERILDCGVIDRTQAILDIFALHASTAEGKIAVELAMLQYLLPHLTGKGRELSRLGGGIGTRGPGETKLETDRRRVRERISKLKKELAGVEKRRRQASQRRRTPGGPFRVALVGYTNSGKTTLLNTLTASHAYTENGFFSTLDPTTRRLTLANGRQVVLSDTVGFISKLPHQLVEGFRATLEEVVVADVILLVADASDPRLPAQLTVVQEVLEELGAEHIPQILVLNKRDKLGAEELTARLEVRAEAVAVSALRGDNLSELLLRIEKQAMRHIVCVRAQFDRKDVAKTKRFRRYAQVIHESNSEDGKLVIEAWMERTLAESFPGLQYIG